MHKCPEPESQVHDRQAQTDSKPQPMLSYYTLMNLQEDCSQEEAQAMYKKLAKVHHPDKGGDEEQFKLIATAKETLLDPLLRVLYNHELAKNRAALSIGSSSVFGEVRSAGSADTTIDVDQTPVVEPEWPIGSGLAGQ